MYSRETLTGTSSERLSPSNFGVQVCWDMSVQMQMHTLWRFDGEPSRMPSVSRALWAACIHSGDGATPPASSTAMSSAPATREVDIFDSSQGLPLYTVPYNPTQIRNCSCSQVGTERSRFKFYFTAVYLACVLGPSSYLGIPTSGAGEKCRIKRRNTRKLSICYSCNTHTPDMHDAAAAIHTAVAMVCRVHSPWRHNEIAARVCTQVTAVSASTGD